MACFLLIQDAATLTVAEIFPASSVAVFVDGRLTSLLLGPKQFMMPGKGRRAVVRAPSSVSSEEVQVTKVKTEAKNGSTVQQNGSNSKISDFFKPSPTEDANGSLTPVKVNGATSVPLNLRGSAKKHIIQVPTDDFDVHENGGIIHDRVKRINTRRKVPFGSPTVKDEEAQLSVPVKSEARSRIITRSASDGDSRKLTDYFPIRRSSRLTRSRIIKKVHSEVEEALINGTEDGLKVQQILGKGRGVVASKNFKRGEFVVEYAGELITMSQARQRELLYAQDENKGCYMYYFLHNNRRYCVDATEETGRFGRLVNHSRCNGNLVTKTFAVGEQPHLILVAKRDIDDGEELLYDYGDRSKMSLEAHPWLAT